MLLQHPYSITNIGGGGKKKIGRGNFYSPLLGPGIATAAGRLVMVMYDTIAPSMFAVKPQDHTHTI